MKPAVTLLTPKELVAVINALEPRAGLTPRRLRYLDSTLGLVRPLRAGDASNAGRMYGATDVAMLRLILRVLAVRSHRETWGAVLYLWADLWEAFERGQALSLAFVGRRAAVMPSAAVPPHADVYDLRACTRGVGEAMRRQRAQAPEVWLGHTWASAPTLAAMAQTAAEEQE